MSMDIKKMTTQHIKNRIAFIEKRLKERPQEQVYIGDSYYSEQAVEQENRYNEQLANEMNEHIQQLKLELSLRQG